MDLLLAENEAEESTLVKMVLSIVSGFFCGLGSLSRINLLDEFQNHDWILSSAIELMCPQESS